MGTTQARDGYHFHARDLSLGRCACEDRPLALKWVTRSSYTGKAGMMLSRALTWLC